MMNFFTLNNNKTGYTGRDSFILNVLQSGTVEKARCFIADQLADMRTKIKECNDKTRALILARLIYLSVRGENTSFAQVEVLKLMSHPQLSFKRIGYLAASILLDGSNDLAILLPQTVVKDLQSSNIFFQFHALTLISNLGNADLCRAAAPEISRLIESSNVHIQKRAGMAALTSVRLDHDHLETFRPAVAKLLNSSKHSVVSAGINLAIEMLQINPQLSTSWRGFITPFSRILKTLFEVRPGREFDFNTFNDPFLQIRILKCLSVLKSSSDELDDILTTIITGLDCRRNTARGILLQAVETISSCAKKPSLRGLAINQIGRLFTYKTPLVYYAALSAFSRFLFSDGTIIDRGSADSQALQRYKSQIVQCLDHLDPSIRRRALDVISALINEDNIETLFPEIMSYMKLVDTDFKTEIVPKLFTAIQRFSPSLDWTFDSVLRLMTDCENYISGDIIISFCRIITKNVEHRSKMVQQLQNILVSYSTNQPIVQTASWVIGEYQNEDASCIESMEKILKLPQTTIETRGYLITALSKIATRFNMIQQVGTILVPYQKSNSIEIQQRTGEMVRILAKPTLASQVLAPIEDKPETQEESGLSVPTTQTPTTPAPAKQEEQVTDDLLNLDLTTPQPQPQNKPSALDDLLQISGSEGQQPPQQLPQQPNQNTPNSSNPQVPADQNTQNTQIQLPPGAVEALRTNDYVVYFEIQRNAGNPNQIAIRSSIYGLSNVALKQFSMQFGVPTGWVIAAKQPSGNVLAKGQNPIQQIILLENRGTIPLMMKTQTSYIYGTQPIHEMGQINSIF